MTGAVAGRPVLAAVERVVELGAAHAGGVGAGADSVHRYALRSGFRRKQVAAGGAAIAGGHEDGLALSRSLAPKRSPQALAAIGESEFAVKVAHGDDWRHIVGNGILRGQDDAVGGATGGGDELNRGVLGERAGPLHVQRGFGFVHAVRHARIDAVDEDLHRIVGREASACAEGAHVVEVEVRAPYHRKALAGAVETLPVERGHIVNGSPIARHHQRHAVGQGIGGHLGVRRRQAEIVQRDHAFYHRGEPRWDLQIRRVGEMFASAHGVASHARVEGRLHLPHRAAEDDGSSRSRNLIHAEPVRGEPVHHLL